MTIKNILSGFAMLAFLYFMTTCAHCLKDNPRLLRQQDKERAEIDSLKRFYVEFDDSVY